MEFNRDMIGKEVEIIESRQKFLERDVVTEVDCSELFVNVVVYFMYNLSRIFEMLITREKFWLFDYEVELNSL